MHYLYGILTATAAIIAAEIVFNYSLGDVLKDGFLYVYHFIKRTPGVLKTVAINQLQRAESRMKAAARKLKGLL